MDPLLSWRREGPTLWCPTDVSPVYRGLLDDYLLHRLRLLRARVSGLLHAEDVRYADGCLRLVFRDEAELTRATAPSGGAPASFQRWRDDELLPALTALFDCHRQDVVGFAPFVPVQGRWVPPVSWFLPRAPGSIPEAERRRDLRHVRSWLLTRRDQVPPPRRTADVRLVESLCQALDAADGTAERKVLDECREAAREARRSPAAPSFLTLLTEAELLERLAGVYLYRLIRRDEAERLGLPTREAVVLEVDARWTDPHFPKLVRPTPQELWDTLLDESRTTPLLSFSEGIPNPLAPRSNGGWVRWIGVHADQPFLYVHVRPERLPPRGFVHLYEPGDLVLMDRKRTFTGFAGSHPALAPHLAPAPPRPFSENPRPREALEAAILAHRGVFAVQGPPGTGKTYLATQVVRRFLAATPGGRVLICAKEHFALDHILRTVTRGLDEDRVAYRAFRSASLARRRRSRGELDPTFLAPAITRELAARGWAPSAESWTRFQVSTVERHDERLRSLGERAATLFFCTTLDAALVGLLEQESFDLVIVEEAGKCYPSELLHAACLGRTVLMIGDQRQLPPYQERRTREGLNAWQAALEEARRRPERRDELHARFGDTFLALEAWARERSCPLSQDEAGWLRPFEHLFDRLDARHRLEEQFRMEAPLSRVVGKVFYGRPFVHHKAAANPLEGVLPLELDVPLLWLDTPHMSRVPEATEDSGKRGVRDNAYERDVILAYLRCLHPVRPVDLVLLTPYNAQKRLLLDSAELREVCAKLTPKKPFEQIVRTTDEYQGREAEFTVLSLVRNNSLGARAWGFMTEPERLNVMFSRARFRQVVVGCSAHVLRHAEDAKCLRAVWEAYTAEAADPRCARIRPARELAPHG